MQNELYGNMAELKSPAEIEQMKEDEDNQMEEEQILPQEEDSNPEE